MATPVEQIKERLPIAEVARSYLKLEKAGRNLKARCPFHNEKTPSFFLSPERNTYYCFGCGAKGDIFTLVEHFEGLDFRGALESLAKRAGVELTDRTPGDSVKKEASERIFQLVEDATKFFESTLTEHSDGLKYLQERGLTDHSITSWRLGYAKEEWRNLFEWLMKKGYNEADIEAAGFIKKTDKGWYDRFRGRIMFPIADASGRVIAFSGRLYPKKEEEGLPKYLNSPETPLFHKSKVLYGLDRAKGVIRKSDFAIVVEGQMDLLMMHQSGFPNAVATSGTSLTEEHLRILKRFSDNLLLAMDGDNAGTASATRGAALALSMGMNVKIATFPKGEDPADVAHKNIEGLREIVRDSLHVIDFLTNMIQARGYDERKFRLVVQKEVFPFVGLLKNRIDREHFIQRLANRLSLPEEAIRSEVARAESPLERVEEKVPVKPEVVERSQLERVRDRLIGMLLIEEGKPEPLIDTVSLRATLSEFVEVPIPASRATVSEELLFETERLYEESSLLTEEAKELVLLFKKEYLKIRYRELMRQLKEAEVMGHAEETARLLQECATILKTIESVEVSKPDLNAKN